MGELESLRQLWTVCLWYFGISTTVTVGLFGWLIKLQGRVGIKESIREDLDAMRHDLKEIKTAIIGDYDKKGLMTKTNELEKRIQFLEDR